MYGKSRVTKNSITRMNKNTRSNKGEKWRHARTSIEIARKIENSAIEQ